MIQYARSSYYHNNVFIVMLPVLAYSPSTSLSPCLSMPYQYGLSVVVVAAVVLWSVVDGCAFSVTGLLGLTR